MFLRKLATSLVCAASFSGYFIHPAVADQIDDIKDRGNLVCGTLGATRGLSFMDDSTRQVVGYEVDLCSKLAERLGVEASIKILPPQARIAELEQSRLDVLFADLAWTEERAKVVAYSHPYFVVRTTVMVRDDSGFSAFADLAGQKISTIKGSTTEQRLRTTIPEAQIVSFDSTAQAFLAFTQGKVAGFATDETRLRSSRSAAGLAGDHFILLSEDMGVDASGAGVRKGEAGMLSLVNDMLLNLEQSGEADTLFMKWFGPGTSAAYERRDFKIDGTSRY